jgi:uncharacterized protein
MIEPFHILAKPAGARCNLNCRYCFYLAKESLYPDATFRMSEAVLESFIRQTIEAQRGPDIYFTWQGGEPTLMGLEFFRLAAEFEKKYERKGKRLHHSIQTNGTLIDAEWCRFFKDQHYLVGLSLDGPQELHDTYRVDKKGIGTFSRVFEAAKRLRETSVDFNILCTVNAANEDHPLDVYRFFMDEVCAKFIQFIPVVTLESPSAGLNRKAPDYSVSPDGYGRFLCEIFDEWVYRDIGRVFVQMFDVALAGWSGQPHGLCVHSPVCGRALALEHNGDLYACDHFVDSDHFLGNILEDPLVELIEGEKQKRFGWAKTTQLSKNCVTCPVGFICQGGCPKDRTRMNGNGEGEISYLCASYRQFFRHINIPMQRMAGLLGQKRPPSELMKIMREMKK